MDRNRDALLARDITVQLDGPHVPQGMDFVYLLRLDSARVQGEAVLFLGGTVLLSVFDKASHSTEESRLDHATEAELTAALTLLTDRV